MATGWRQCRVCKKDKHITQFRMQKKSAKRVQTCNDCLGSTNEDARRINGTHKVCSCCQTELTVDHFRKRPPKPDGKNAGYRSRCRDCEKSGWKAAGLEGVNKPMDAKQTPHDLGAEAHRDLLVRFYLERRVT